MIDSRAAYAIFYNKVLADVHHAGPEEATLTALVSNGLSLFSLSFFIWLMRLLGHI